MKKIDKLLLEVTRGENEQIGTLPDFQYGLGDFKLELFDNTSLDWKKILEGAKTKISWYLQAVTEYNQGLRSLFRIDGSEKPEKPETKTVALDPLDFLSESPKQTLEDWLCEHIETLNECLAFYEKHRHSPPFSYPVLKENKIPFWGTQDEFIALINLLENRGIYFGTTRINFLHKKGYEGFDEILTKPKRSDKEDEIFKIIKHGVLQHNDFCKYLCSFFYLVKYEKNELIETAINFSTCKSKMRDNSFENVGTSGQEDMIAFFNRVLKKMGAEHTKSRKSQ